MIFHGFNVTLNSNKSDLQKVKSYNQLVEIDKSYILRNLLINFKNTISKQLAQTVVITIGADVYLRFGVCIH